VEKVLALSFIHWPQRPSWENIPAALFDEARDQVEQLILARLGGLTKVRVIEGWGRTLSWADEQSTLLASITENPGADHVFQECADLLARSLQQEQIWVVKQQTDLFISALND
jgi:uncharacterized membrane-anchored protein YjiN (DUF445 family)